ncbi:MetQ/NlpA family ABC transporter substrate-binding protein [Cellulosilyticum lentocellum]|uniref:Lipoprotein n=1 Tax=Cellulosilyticum lentocellum (strain ATCC 49066 / DSM 5427 / NCIMB 11756 / RHM5) TaxID=642492 RepID=F2JKG6_CELLD|nr:MetQ/NlpA family ABC transporter substrate-binding protein [Cellulosilyticum lentocellum]ADZ82126.1 NLPA lipoprotein [Cellulosilyticum lentocellum DSM 5427]
MNKKKLLSIILTGVLALGVSACGTGKPTSNEASNTTQTEKTDSGEKTVLKIGVNGTDFRLWDNINERLAEYNIELEPVSFSDYIKPNLALADGEIDLNAFQHELYFENFIKEHSLDLSSIGYTFIAPLGLYSNKIKSLDEVKDGATVAIPNDATNGGRALLLLESAGLITLDGTDKVTPTTKNIAENPKKLEFVSMESVQIPRSLADVDFAAINGGAATDAGIYDYIYREDPEQENAQQYFNVIAVRTEDKDKDVFKKIMEVYHTDETKKAIEEIYSGAYIPVW